MKVKFFIFLYVIFISLFVMRFETVTNDANIDKIKFFYGSDMKDSNGEIVTEISNIEFYGKCIFGLTLVYFTCYLMYLTIFIAHLKEWLLNRKKKKFYKKHQR